MRLVPACAPQQLLPDAESATSPVAGTSRRARTLSTRNSRHQKAAASAIALFSIGMLIAGHVAEQTASTSAAPGKNTAAALELQEETTAAKTIAGIRAAGALQATYDRKTARYSAVFPAGSALPALPAPVDTVITPLDKASIDRFGEVVKTGTWVPGATDHTYVYSVDAKTGKLDLRTSAPPAVIEALPQEFRSLLQVRYSDSGATELGRMDDLSPYKGGASICTAAKTCSSGSPSSTGKPCSAVSSPRRTAGPRASRS
jgi:hypothetical protein